MIKDIAIGISLLIALYLMMIGSVFLAMNIQQIIAKGYIKNNCELIVSADQTDSWYECDK